MAEPAEYEFSHKEAVTALIRQQGLHEGLWMLSVRFGFTVTNITAAGGDEMNPAAIVPVTNIGLRRVTEENSLTVDAAKVNPAPKPMPKLTPKRKAPRKKKISKKK